MPAQASAAAVRRLGVGLLGFGATALFAWLAIRNVDRAELWGVLRAARPLPWLPLAVLSYVSGHFLRGYRCRLLAARTARLSVVGASNIVVAGYAGNNILPGRLGELVRAAMLVQRTGMPLIQALTITAIERISDGIAILLLLAGAVYLIPPVPWLTQMAELGVLVFGVALALLVFAILAPGTLLAGTARLAMRAGPRAQERVVRAVSAVIAGAGALRAGSVLARVIALSPAIWLLEAGLFALVMPAVGLSVSLSAAVLAMAVTNLAILIPSAPGFVGVFHFFCAQALVLQGTPREVALAYATLVHLTFYVPVTIWGVGVVLARGVSAANAALLAFSARRAPVDRELGGLQVGTIGTIGYARVAPAPSGFERALAEAIIPASDQAGHAPALDVAARFISHTTQALPTRLRVLFRCGMLAFRCFVVARYGGGFARLSVARRRAALEAWAFGPIALLRQLFRPVRSTALLAYFDTLPPPAADAAQPVPLGVRRTATP